MSASPKVLHTSPYLSSLLFVHGHHELLHPLLFRVSTEGFTSSHDEAIGHRNPSWSPQTATPRGRVTRVSPGQRYSHDGRDVAAAVHLLPLILHHRPLDAFLNWCHIPQATVLIGAYVQIPEQSQVYQLVPRHWFMVVGMVKEDLWSGGVWSCDLPFIPGFVEIHAPVP